MFNPNSVPNGKAVSGGSLMHIWGIIHSKIATRGFNSPFVMREIKSYTVITLALILLCGSISIYTLYRVNYLNRINQTTEQVIKRTNAIQIKVLEYENSSLSFAVTADTGFLDTMEVIKSQLNQNIDQLTGLVGTDDFQDSRLDSIRSLLAARQYVFENSIISNPTVESLLDYVKLNTARNYSTFGSKIKDQTDAILVQQRHQMNERELGILTNLSALGIVLFTITVVGILSALLSFYSIYKYNLAQQASQHELKDFQAKLSLQIEQLNTTNKELEQFAYVASHDLQEPLRKITSFNDLLQDQYKGALEGDGSLYLERIAFAANRMRKLIADLLEYSRAGRYAEDKELISLNLVVDEILDDLSIQIEQKKAAFEIDELPSLIAHPSDWRMVFQNLISNALKFTKPGQNPRISITCRVAEEALLREYQANRTEGMDYHHIEVRDNGIGFNNTYANKIFTIFQRLHGKDEYEGTGIGLAICKKIVERYGGVIFATSMIGEGSSFQILIPAEQSPIYQT